MKDIDTMLSQHTPKPKRELNSYFTESVIAGIKNGYNEEKEPNRLRLALRWIHTIPGMVALLIALATCGLTAYAVTSNLLSSSPSTTPTVTQSPTDPTIITVSLNNCLIPWFNGDLQPAPATNPIQGPEQVAHDELENGPTQFKLLKPAEYPASVVKNGILEFCEQQGITDFYKKIEPSWAASPPPADTRYNGYYGKILSISSSQVTIQMPWSGQVLTITYPLTSSVSLYKDETSITVASLHAGDYGLFHIEEHGDYDSPDWRPTPPTAATTTLLSIDKTQYDLSQANDYFPLSEDSVLPLSLYNEEQALTAAFTFYEKNDPDWSITHAPSHYSSQTATVASIGQGQLELTFAGSPYPQTADVTLPISQSTTIYESGKSLPISALHIGDTVFVVIYQPNSEDQFEATNDPTPGTTIASMTRIARKTN